MSPLLRTACIQKQLAPVPNPQSRRLIMYGARQIIRPVPFKERPVFSVSMSNRPGIADDIRALQSNINPLRPVLHAFRNEPDVAKRAGSPLRNSIAVGSADGPCAPASAALRQIKLQRFQDSFRSDRALSPLESAQDLIGAVS